MYGRSTENLNRLYKKHSVCEFTIMIFQDANNQVKVDLDPDNLWKMHRNMKKPKSWMTWPSHDEHFSLKLSIFLSSAILRNTNRISFYLNVILVHPISNEEYVLKVIVWHIILLNNLNVHTLYVDFLRIQSFTLFSFLTVLNVVCC